DAAGARYCGDLLNPRHSRRHGVGACAHSLDAPQTSGVLVGRRPPGREVAQPPAVPASPPTEIERPTMNTICTMKGSSKTRYPRAIGAVIVASALMLGATACAQSEPENTDPAAPTAAKITVAVPFGEGNPAAI